MFTLGREIDIHYPTNKIIIILSLVTAFLGWIITGDISSGLYIGGGVFLTWALAREVDPIYEYSAFLCVFLSLVNIFYYDQIQILVVFWILLTMRLVSGVTGKEVTSVDISTVLILTIYLTISNENSIYLIPFIIAIGFILALRKKSNPAMLAGGLAFLVLLAEIFIMDFSLFTYTGNSGFINIATVSIILVSFIFWFFSAKDHFKDDLGNKISSFNILASQITYSLIVLLLYFFGNLSTNNLLIYLSVIVGVVIYRLVDKILILINN